MEWYQQVHAERKKTSLARHREYYMHPATAAIDPFRIADGLYYVGDKKVCGHLIETSEGLILLDSGSCIPMSILIISVLQRNFAFSTEPNRLSAR